jgi:adenylyltransferase/sulfurtransferase
MVAGFAATAAEGFFAGAGETCASAGNAPASTTAIANRTRIIVPRTDLEVSVAQCAHRANAVTGLDRSRYSTLICRMLSADELERYARHIVLHEVGGPGQAKLKQARVLVIGAGGLGAPVLLYLAAAGVGTIGIVDDDKVSLSNLQRQVIHATPDLDRRKVDSAAAAVGRLNPHVRIETHAVRLTAANALDLIGRYDIVADGSDNFATRYLVSDACYLARKPLVTGAVGTFDATLTTLRAHERGTDGKLNPTYRCLFPEPPPPGTVPACAEAGILGALPGILGSMMALEIIREIVGFGEGLVGRLLMIDARAMRFETLTYGWDPSNPLSGEKPTIKDLSAHAQSPS